MFESINTGEVVSEGQLKELFPHTLFPVSIGAAQAAQLGFRIAAPRPLPSPPPFDPVAARRAAYATESDHLKIEAEYDALIAGTATDYTAWIAAVTAIKERYPLETSSDE